MPQPGICAIRRVIADAPSSQQFMSAGMIIEFRENFGNLEVPTGVILVSPP
jgi:hypothetical protein